MKQISVIVAITEDGLQIIFPEGVPKDASINAEILLQAIEKALEGQVSVLNLLNNKN